MGIVDWFTNDLNTEERALTRDLLSVAIADHEFSEEERKTLLETCQLEGVSLVGMMDSIREEKAGTKVFHSSGEKKQYLLHLIRMMAADGKFSDLELRVIEVVAKKMDIMPIQILSLVLDEIKAKHFSDEEGTNILDHFVKHFMETSARI